MQQLKNIKMIISDFDHTLTDNHDQVSNHSKETIKKFIENGGIFGIATGRSLPLLSNKLLEMNIEQSFPLITYQGAVISKTNGEILDVKYLPLNVVIKVSSYLEKNHIHFHLSTIDTLYAPSYVTENDFYNRANVFHDLLNTYQNLTSFIEENPKDFVQITIITMGEDADPLKEILNNKFIGDVNFVKSHARIIETTELSTSKGQAIKDLALLYQIEHNEIMVIGDSPNDLSMFNEGFYKVAVDNAHQMIKEKADYISLACDQDGVAHMILKVIESKK